MKEFKALKLGEQQKDGKKKEAENGIRAGGAIEAAG